MHRFPVRVYIEDTDAGGIVFYANYLKFFERARTEMLRLVGIEQSTTLQSQVGFVVRRVTVDYVKPARLDDQLIIQSRVIDSSRLRVRFHQQARCALSQVVLAEAEVDVVSVRLDTLRPTAMPIALVNHIRQQFEGQHV